MSDQTPFNRNASLGAVFAELKSILDPYARGLVATADSAEEFSLDTKHIQKNGKPLFFAAVRMRKSDVSFHLMPIYVRPELLDGLSHALKKRMQGKSCFNFAVIDTALFRELAHLTAAGFLSYKEQGFIDVT